MCGVYTDVCFLTYTYRTKHAKPLVDVRDRRGLTPLHVACFNNNMELVQLLLKAGADPEIRYYFCSSILYYSAPKQESKAFKLYQIIQ